MISASAIATAGEAIAIAGTHSKMTEAPADR
jgi:hypothetical protein